MKRFRGVLKPPRAKVRGGCGVYGLKHRRKRWIYIGSSRCLELRRTSWRFLLRRLSVGRQPRMASRLFRSMALGTSVEDWVFVVLEEFVDEVSDAVLWEAELRWIHAARVAVGVGCLNVSVQARSFSTGGRDVS